MFRRQAGKRNKFDFILVLESIFAASILAVPVLQPASAGEADESVPVKTAQVVERTIRSKIPVTGTVEAWRKVILAPNISGKVDEIFVEAGDYVEKGDLLARLDTEPITLQLNRAKAAFSVAKASHEDARVNYDRMNKLQEKGTVSPQQFEKTELALESARANLEQAEANLKLAEYHLDESIINAPFSGFITSRNADPGDLLSTMPGYRGVATLMHISSVKIRSSVSIRNIQYVQKETEALVSVDIYPDTIFTGEVYSVSPAANVNTRSFPIEIKVGNGNLKLKPGMFAHVELVARRRENAPAIPTDAVISSETGDYVYVVEDGRAQRRNITTGLREGLVIEVTEGLSPGETVITTGKMAVQDGNMVRVEGGTGR